MSLSNVLPQDQKPEVAYLRALRSLLPKGLMWGFTIVESLYTAIQNTISLGNTVQDNVSGSYSVWQNHISGNGGSNYADTKFGTMLSCFAAELKRFENFCYGIVRESVPGLSEPLLERWESEMGEPSSNIVNPDSRSLSQRQASVHEKLYYPEPSLNAEFYIDYFENKYNITLDIDSQIDELPPFLVSENGTPVTGIGSRVGERLNQHLLSSVVEIGFLGGPHDPDTIQEIKNFMEELKPAHIAIQWET